MADLFRSIINLISIFAIPLMIAVFLGWGFVKKVRVYEVFVEGAKDGFNTAIRIIPIFSSDVVCYRYIPCKRCDGYTGIDNITSHKFNRYAGRYVARWPHAPAIGKRFIGNHDRVNENARPGFVYRRPCINDVRQFGDNILCPCGLFRSSEY